ncbi:MAG: enoyl-CoA hydratase-related protein [Flavobacteriaceae bacterium]|nr:enoyl-CoA hydratase-related protein [Flavobacteriaceae bacterium]
MSESVTTRIEGRVGFLEFGSSKANSLTSSLINSISEALLSLDSNPQVKSILIKSQGNKVFSAGASLVEMSQLKNIAQTTVFFDNVAQLLLRFRNLTKFVVMQVQGKVVGGGLGLVAVADYVVAYQHADIKLSELSIGLGPYVIAPAIQRKIGIAAFNELSIEAHQFKPAPWVLNKGLYNKLVFDKTNLEFESFEMALRLSKYSSNALKTLRNLHWKDTEHWDILLKQNAEITAQLALQQPTQDILKQWKKSD